jgi:hypothetical protein
MIIHEMYVTSVGKIRGKSKRRRKFPQLVMGYKRIGANK